MLINIVIYCIAIMEVLITSFVPQLLSGGKVTGQYLGTLYDVHIVKNCYVYKPSQYAIRHSFCYVSFGQIMKNIYARLK